MSLKSPNKTLFNQDGYELIVKDGASLPQDNAALLIAGSDGTDTHYISLDSDGNKIIAGAGTSGSPDGGVLSLQGTASENGDELKIMGHVDIDNFPTDLSIVQDNAAELLASVGGLGASGSVIVGNPVRLGAPEAGTYGSVDNFTNNIKSDSSGRLQIAGPFGAGGYGPGTVIAGAPVRIGASDGSLTTDILSDSSGRLIEVGAAAAGSAIAGAPVRLGGSDETDTQDILTDSAGRILFSGAAASGDAVVGAPVRLAGSDSTDTRDLLTDTAGRLIRVGADAAGSVPTGNPVLTAGWDGTNVQIFKLDSLGAVQVNDVKTSDSTLYETSASTSAATLLASNTARQGAIVYNDSNKFLYIKLGASITSSSFTTRIAPMGQYLVPAGFTGEISGIWTDATAAGKARVTELAPSVGGGGGGGGGASFVTSGLALHLDPGDPSSYSGSGTSWYDLSGNSKHATIQNVSTLTHDSIAGTLTFAEGTWASGPYVGALADWTIFIWARKDAGGSDTPRTQFFVDRLWGGPYGFIFDSNNRINYSFGYTDLTSYNGGGSTSYVTGKTARPSGWAYEAYTTPQQSITTGVWACYAVVKSGLTLSLYVNGSLVGSPTAMPDSNFSSPGIAYNINNDQWHGNYTMNCSIGPLAVYNRGITSSEVTQNWDATRSRFGM